MSDQTPSAAESAALFVASCLILEYVQSDEGRKERSQDELAALERLRLRLLDETGS